MTNSNFIETEIPERKEVKDSIVSRLSERVGEPFLFAFLTSFIIYNWKLIYILWNGSETAVSTTDTIELYINTVGLWKYLVPTMLAALYVLLAPAINSVVKVWVEWVVIIRNNLILQMRVNKRYPISTLKELPEYKELIGIRNHHQKYLEDLWDIVSPEGAEEHTPLIIYTDTNRQITPPVLCIEGPNEKILVPYIYAEKNQKQMALESGKLLYVFNRIGPAVLTISNNGYFPWIADWSKRFLYFFRDGSLEFFDTMPDPERDDAIAYIEQVRQLGHFIAYKHK